MAAVDPDSPCPTAPPPPPPRAGAGAGDGEVAKDDELAAAGVDEERRLADGADGETLAALALEAAVRKYHGVTRVEASGVYEAHLPVPDNAGHIKHVYLGSYVAEEHAARAHDLAALKYWGTGPNTKLNFNISDYEKEIEIMKTMSQDEFVAYIRRQSSCFSRGTSSYRGVTRRKDGKWQARIGRIGESRDTKDIYLGTFETEEEAPEAYDIAAIKSG